MEQVGRSTGILSGERQPRSRRCDIYTASKGDYDEIAGALIEYEVFPGKS
ncbi:MAG: hypothetical protein H7138_01490 [Myxococcales bacterium]|nr:hypothetical protein [Myxococcales bacterium]